MTTWDYLSKFVIVGDSSCGKSSLLIRLTENRFLVDTEPTVGVEFGSHIVKIDETNQQRPTLIKCQVWDTAGSETFRSITRSYYRGAAGALLVYNVTHRPSFLHIGDWLRDVREHAEENVSIILVGNMADLCNDDDHDQDEDTTVNNDPSDIGSEGQEPEGEGATQAKPSLPKRERRNRRQVTRQEAEKFVKQEGIMFVETSAKTGHNVEEAFQRAAQDIYSKFKSSPSNNNSTHAGLQAGNSRPGVVAASMQDTETRDGRGCCTIA